MQQLIRLALTGLATMGLVGAGSAIAAPVSASEKAEVEALSERGVEAYRTGRFAEAIQYFQKAYAVFPEPKLLYNLGRAHEKLGDAEAAMIFFEQALSDPATPAPVRLKARLRLTELTRRAAAAKAPDAAPPSAAPPSAAPPSAAPPSVAAPSSAAPPSVVRIVAPPAEPIAPPSAVPVEPDDHAIRSGAGWTLLGVGGASVIIGGIAYAAGANDHQTLEDAKAGGVGALTRAEALALRDDGDSRKTLGITLLAVGGGALVSALAVFLSGSDAAEAHLVPTDRGLGFGGRF